MIKRILCMLFCIVILCSFASAEHAQTLEEKIDSFISENGLNEENFALSYFNESTGDSYHYNEQTFFPTGYVWTLPLHMYYCAAEYRGDFEPVEGDENYNDPDYEYTIAGRNLDICRTESILNSNEDVSNAMRDAVLQYYNVINEEFGHIDEALLPTTYYKENRYSTKFFFNCLKTISRESEIYGEVMRLYDLVQTADGILSDELPITTNYRTVQIRGQENGMICVVAEVSAPQTYQLSCFISEAIGGDRLLAELNALIADHVLTEVGDTVTAPTESLGLEHSDSTFHINTKQKDNSKLLLIIVAAIGAAGVISLAVYFLFFRKRR